mmetsp:Transcript_27023/g.59441  ORF Transcript_27023/g.59441 Transcript_27023/m.59441 type:complete len:224 (-) Transcript_27023:304-975(-)|eukprot:CAMPEP_0168188050 /NCGR_PEP_ID=MMETSP0139_2-20121125/15393_1 /TAXON_ID=44445 /ORGANISM="Pseudo-nitzschia australis, Strain 10249 10 AB" /LENGTH=223 /DNA_ID=CAMNT_0008110367 /DNA_START=109 /DNA_END=780 /DNA_ORIENTATION=-
MEVASPPPVPFGRGSAKRHYPGSPGFVDATNRNPFAMISGDSSDEYMQQRSFKRRRFTSTDEMMGGDTENNQNQSFVQFQQPIVAKGNYTISSHGPHSKRSRTEHQSTQQINELQNVVNSHGAEIESLKSDKVGLEESLNTLKTEHDKVVYENKTLKRAVVIQQERQNQALSEINAGRQFKAEAEDRIKKLEQLVLSLRYHLQTQQHNTPGNDFMGFRPPDVY